MKGKVLALGIAVLMVFMMAGAAMAGEKSAVASFLPIAIFAENVSGGLMKVDLLVPPGEEVHDFSLRPKDIKRLDAAGLILLNGAGLEDVMMKPFGRRERLVDTSAGVKLIGTGEATNPHIWLDPRRAIQQVHNIEASMAKADPKNADAYKRNAEGYIKRLTALDSDIEKGLAGLGNRNIVTYHAFMGYFDERYGLDGFSLSGLTGEEPLPANIAKLHDMIKNKSVRAIFMEEGFPPAEMKKLSRDLGVRMCSIASLEQGKNEPGYYEEITRKNLKTILECAGGK